MLQTEHITNCSKILLSALLQNEHWQRSTLNPVASNGSTASRSLSLIFCETPTCISMLSHSVTPIAYRLLRTAELAIFPWVPQQQSSHYITELMLRCLKASCFEKKLIKNHVNTNIYTHWQSIIIQNKRLSYQRGTAHQWYIILGLSRSAVDNNVKI